MDKKDFVKSMEVEGRRYDFYDIHGLEKRGIAQVGILPLCVRVLVENLLRKMDGEIVREDDLINIARWQKSYSTPIEIPFHPARVLMQDFTGVPAVVDLAAMRDAMQQMQGDPGKINPLVPTDLVVDHSAQADYYGTAQCRKLNVEKEYLRNGERYTLLKWAQKSFDNFRVVPAHSGICHQVNLEYLSRVIAVDEVEDRFLFYPETLIGTDSHTTMINGVGVLGWGVGGIEAEAVILGQPYYMAIPEVVGVELSGRIHPGVTATDIALYITQVLRKYGVVEKFVEFFGAGLDGLSVPDRATLSNMAPEYGATIGFMPVDDQTIQYLRKTGRGSHARVVEECSRALGLFRADHSQVEYTDVLQIALGDVEPSVAGPSRPHSRIVLKELAQSFNESNNPSAASSNAGKRAFTIEINGMPEKITDGSVVMAAITSCTNTSNPRLLIGAGLMARNAVKHGLRVPGFVKTVLAPGSKVVARYLESSGLMPYMEALGFHIAGFGCMVCIGNSGPLHLEVERVISEQNLNVAAVISGNRNFEARIHPRIKSNFLASPLLVVAFALAGRVDVDLVSDPLGTDPNGRPVYLHEIWPDPDEIESVVAENFNEKFFSSEYSTILEGDELWQGLKVEETLTFPWDKNSSYVKSPPYFEDFALEPKQSGDLRNARALLILEDGVTTDHISPAGSIPQESPSGRYLIHAGISPQDFNSYGSRRGNHEVLIRGTFGNIRLKNRMVSPKEGSFTKKYPENEIMHVFDAARSYKVEGVPLLVFAGREYGTGSSRDWAAKGTALLGVKAVIAQSFERIHRSNLIGMGVLPLTFRNGENCESLGLDGSELYDIQGIENLEPRGRVNIKATKADGKAIDFAVTARVDTAVEIGYLKNNGIMDFMLRKILKG